MVSNTKKRKENFKNTKKRKENFKNIFTLKQGKCI